VLPSHQRHRADRDVGLPHPDLVGEVGKTLLREEVVERDRPLQLCLREGPSRCAASLEVHPLASELDIDRP
jgi:hypothetical protein